MQKSKEASPKMKLLTLKDILILKNANDIRKMIIVQVRSQNTYVLEKV